MTRSTPVEDESTAYRVATLPLEYGTARINQLFTRGYNRYIVDDEDQPEDLLNDLERFGTAAFKEDVRANAAEEPFVDEPGTLAVLATLSAVCVKAHPKFEHAPPRTVQVLYDIRELYVNNLASLLREFGDGSLQQDIAEVLYAKDPGEDGPHPGRVCTGIKEMPEFGDGLYLEIPMAAASRKCLVHADTETGEAGELLTRVKNNCLYVPVGDFDTKYREYARRAFKKLLRVQEENLSEDQLTWLTTNESAITERIDRFIETGHHERIWRDWNPGERTIRVLRDAIRDAPDEVVSLGSSTRRRSCLKQWRRTIQKRAGSETCVIASQVLEVSGISLHLNAITGISLSDSTEIRTTTGFRSLRVASSPSTSRQSKTYSNSPVWRIWPNASTRKSQSERTCTTSPGW